jgi:predicted enzyme related to lactoylglutathione lyase
MEAGARPGSGTDLSRKKTGRNHRILSFVLSWGRKKMMQQHYEFPPTDGFILTHVLPVADVKRSAAFYADVFGGTIVREGSPTIVQVANTWILVDVGGGPSEDKPTITLAPPKNADEVSCFMNIRVADIHSCYERWRARGAQFITEPKDLGGELRYYIRDLDGYLIEVGQAK